jgi:quercetin dioxygenase-like cupin family protein
MLENVRRIVTGHDKSGHSIVLLNERPAKMREFPGMGLGDAWITTSVPADNSKFEDLAPTYPQLQPPKGGARIAWFWHGKDDPNRKWQRTGDPAIIMDDTKRHHAMHRTNTLDYVVLIKGRMRMLLDQGEIDMNPGDVMVQRGTNHAWTNIHDEPALLFSIMMDATPGVAHGEAVDPSPVFVPDSPFQHLKRTITGHNERGEAVALYHGPAVNGMSSAAAGLGEIWQTMGLPADFKDARDLSRGPVKLEPEPGSIKVRWFWIMPEAGGDPAQAQKTSAATFAAIGAAHARTDSARHPGMHKTRSVDYIVCLKGNSTLLLDEDEVDLKPGDVVVQRGTSHSWINKGPEPALYLAVLVDAKP